VTINDRALPTTTAVTCAPIGWLTTITTGTPGSGLTALVSNESELKAKSVSITELGGFTGRYMRELEGKADIRMAGRTYLIRGTAHGFNADNPSVRTTGTFAIRVSC
jgi:lipoprotein LpqH